jgi:hypothetical protein
MDADNQVHRHHAVRVGWAQSGKGGADGSHSLLHRWGFSGHVQLLCVWESELTWFPKCHNICKLSVDAKWLKLKNVVDFGGMLRGHHYIKFGFKQ